MCAVPIPVGCGNGCIRDMSGKAQLSIRGRKYPLVGLISMVWTVVSNQWDSAHNDDQVILIGEVDGLAIALQDLILAGAFILTRRIWLCWGIHWGWNFVQDGVLGMPNSGVTYLPSWIIPEVSGPTWLTGGSIGIELSVLGVVLSMAVGVVLLKLAWDRGQVLGPGWRRGR